MIQKVLEILRTTLQDSSIDVIVEDIAKRDTSASNVIERTAITLVSIEEEPTLKNNPRYEQIGDPIKIKKNNPPAYLNLYVMIASDKKYEFALIDISNIIECLQSKKEFLYDTYGLKVQLHSLSFDKLSYVWGMLGGKILPSVLYKVSIVKIQKEDIRDIELIGAVNTDDITEKTQ